MKKFLLATAIIFSFLTIKPAVHAISTGEKIESFDSKVFISHKNVADVQETIVYNFGASPHHGIYRDIPVEYNAENGNKYYITAHYINTTDENGAQVQAETEDNNGNKRIRLGDPNTTIVGIHTYKIHYTLSPIITKKDGHDFLNIDLVGTGWPVPIQKVTSQVTLGSNAQPANVLCFVGSQGSMLSKQNNIPTCAATNLGPYQGVTMNADLAKGYVDHYLVANNAPALNLWESIGKLWFAAIITVVVLIGLAISGLRWWRAHQKRKQQIVVPQYEPPTTLTPAEIGHLEDDSSSMAEITATLISFAVRDYLKITQTDKTGILSVFGGKDYTLTALKPGSDLPPAEAGLYNAFFTKGNEIKLNNLDKYAMSKAIVAFKKGIKASLEEKGYYDITGGMLRRGNLSDAGAKEWALVDGFKLYLNVVEKDRLAFSDAPEKTPERFNKLLPYAIALGVEKQWAKEFEGIDVSQSVSWYSGNMAGFTAVALASDLNSGFASAVSSNSGMSSGGGSAGGGGGGGGGGSW